MKYTTIFFDGKISWDLSNVGIPEFDDHNSLYNMRFEWLPSEKFYELQVSMFDADRKYTQNAIELFWGNIEPENIGKILCQMMGGNTFYSFALLYSEEGELMDFQEGRHRIVACKILGIEKVPVWNFTKKK
jgi:hypothetical protein